MRRFLLVLGIGLCCSQACGDDSDGGGLPKGTGATGGTHGRSTGGSGGSNADASPGTGGGPSAGGSSAGSSSAGSSSVGGSSAGGSGATGGPSGSGGEGVGSGGSPDGGPGCSDVAESSFDDAVTGSALGQFQYTGSWSTATGAGKYQGADHFTSSAGAHMSFRFRGTAVALHGAKAPHHGIARVSIDGGAAVDVDFYSAARAEDASVFASANLADGEHELALEAAGTKNPAAQGTTIAVDRAVVTALACDGGAGTGGTGGTAGTGGTGGTAGTGGTGGTAGTGGTGGTAGSGGGPTGVLTRRGRHLYLNGQPYLMVGVNAFGMAGCQTGQPYSDADMDAFFGSLRANAITRAWAFEAQGMAGIERMVHWAEVHNRLLILTFADGRSYCGETDGRPGGDGSGKVSSWYTSGYKVRYLPWLERVVTRFKDSKAIGMWELINEPGDSNDQAMRAFFDDAAGHVKAIDPVHLVCSGSQAEYVNGTHDYAYVHGGPNIDVASLHEYDYDYMNSHTIVSGHLTPTLNAMRSIDKPLIIGEAGINANDEGGGCTSLTTRRDAFRQKFDAYLAQDGVGLVLVWAWIPRKRGGCGHDTHPGDPLMDLIRTHPL